MAQTHKLSQMDIQTGGGQNHFLQNMLKFGFEDWKNVFENEEAQPHFSPKSPKNWMCG